MAWAPGAGIDERSVRGSCAGSVLLLIVGLAAQVALVDGAASAAELAAAKLALADVDALPRLVEALEAARATNVSGSATDAASKARAAADFHLLAEVASIAGNGLAGVSSDFKAAVASSSIDVTAILAAFDSAARLGVPKEEIDTAWGVLRTEMTARLKSAAATADASPGNTAIKGLASMIHSSHKLGVGETDLASAREVYRKQLENAKTLNDMGYVVAIVSNAFDARVEVDPMLVQWHDAHIALQHAKTLGNDKDSLRQILLAVSQAEAAQLPQDNDAVLLRQRAKEDALLNLNDVLAHECSHETPGHLAHLTESLQMARDAGVSASDLGIASYQLQTLAAQTLGDVLGANQTDAAQVVEGLTIASLANISTLEEAKVSLSTSLHARMGRAVAAAAAPGNASVDQLEELATSISLVHKGAYNESLLTAAREALSSELSRELALGDVPVLNRLAKLASLARVPVPQAVTAWQTALTEVRRAAALPSTDGKALTQMLSALKLASAAALPTETAEVAALRDIALQRAVAHIDVLVGMGSFTAEHAEECRAALEIAELAGLTGMALTDLQAKVKGLSETALRTAVAVGTDNAVAVKESARVARTAGVANVTAVEADFGAAVAARLASARTAATGSAMAEPIAELARAILLAYKWGGLAEEVSAARDVFSASLQGYASGTEASTVENIAELARSHARVTVPEAVLQWAAAQGALRKAMSLPADCATGLPAALQASEAAAAAALPQTAEFVAASARARELASACLQEVSQSSAAMLAQEVVEAAPMAGVSTADLAAGSAVRSAVGLMPPPPPPR